MKQILLFYLGLFDIEMLCCVLIAVFSILLVRVSLQTLSEGLIFIVLMSQYMLSLCQTQSQAWI